MNNRDIYLQRANNNTKTPEEFIQAMLTSPYSTHRRHAKGLAAMHQTLIKLDSASKQDTYEP